MSRRLLIVHHTTSPALRELFESVRQGATTDEIEGVEVTTRPALHATATDVFECDGLILGTPVNIGYMSGALKHFFDTVYYPCLEETQRLPYALYVHGNNDPTGAVRAVESIAAGIGWERVHQPVTVTGTPAKDDLAACWELGATLAATISPA
ncbi:NAD(P)H-dependent oxidoreductase [Nonomuraea monospora]|uniref:NAD(P)H-dependent oxidoreductase n=1 Tax=Nonomuraea monospora TaxID=568818 RepID=A0ABN3D045_9ACTN